MFIVPATAPARALQLLFQRRNSCRKQICLLLSERCSRKKKMLMKMAGLMLFFGSFNIIVEFRHLSLRCCYCLRTYWRGFWQHSSSPSSSHGSIMIRGRYCCSFKHAFRQQSSHHHCARGIVQPPSPSSLPTSPSLERRSTRSAWRASFQRTTRNVHASRGRFVLEHEHQDLLATKHLNEEPQPRPARHQAPE